MPRQYEHSIELDFGNGLKAGKSSDAIFDILGHEGLTAGDIEANVVQYANKEGGIVRSLRHAVRRMVFELDAPQTSWPALSEIFPLDRLYTLKVTRDGITRYIDCKRETLSPIGDQGILDIAGIQVSFLAEQPFFYSPTQIIKPLGVSVGGLEYPINYGIEYDRWDIQSIFTLDNPGTYPVGFELSVTPTIPLPYLELSIEGNTMRFAELVEPGETLSINTMTKTAFVDDRNRLAKVDNWVSVPRGKSTGYITEFLGTAGMKFTPLYEGI